MRIAILADIHGNLPAFEAVVKHVARQKVDQIVLAGDVVNGSPDSKACLALARSLNCPILRGNHERYVTDFGTPKAPPEWASEQFAPLQWTVAQFSDTERLFLGQLPFDLRIPEAPDLYIVHASERSDHDMVDPYTSEQELEAMFPTARPKYIARAHNHYGQVRIWDQRLIVTAGSVGLPLDDNPEAKYLILDQAADGWKIRHQSVPYDVEAAARRFHDTHYLAETGPIGYLFYRELITAAQYLVPFLRMYARWHKQETLTLEEGVERFMGI
jgi:predicted phosphodiesterase